MCGIYGTTLKYSENQIKEKLKRTAFRGPDKMGCKVYRSDKHTVTFGHNRLSVIDLDPRSNQPFTYYDKIHISFNGEVYNFLEVKETLHKIGYTFHTTSDTEVMCAAYLEYGEDCVLHFNGMFSFVIYDENKQLFFGARDRLGQKPFYYYHNKNDFEFSSQISSLQLHHSDLTISSKAISHYLTWGAIPDPMSIFNEVKKLLPGNSFVFDLNTGTFNSKPYWDIDSNGIDKYNGSYDDAKKELTSILSNAVSTRLFADVPVGVFLSGGVDSSVISAIATQNSAKKVKTFSVKFNEKEFDESAYAQKVADHLDTDHHVIECNYDEGKDLIENFHHYYDEPFADSSAIPSLLLSKYTKKEVTVALSGDGGDESFIGYGRYQWAKNRYNLYNIPLPIRQAAGSILNLAPNYRMGVIAKGLKTKNVNKAYVKGLTGIDLSWINTDVNCKDIPELKYLEHTNKNLLERMSDFDLKTYLNWDINTKVDRASMAYSLEVRAPLLDHRVVDFARSLPTSFKYDRNNQKRILKDILYDYVPKQIFNRPKAGFTMPFARWFKEDLKDYVLNELNDESLKKIPSINIEEIKFRINQHMTGEWNRYPLIWKLLVLKQWLNRNGKDHDIR